MNTIKPCLYEKNGFCIKFNIKISDECKTCIFRIVDEKLKELDNLEFIQENWNEES